jgi:hypothetical protein
VTGCCPCMSRVSSRTARPSGSVGSAPSTPLHADQPERRQAKARGPGHRLDTWHRKGPPPLGRVGASATWAHVLADRCVSLH